MVTARNDELSHGLTLNSEWYFYMLVWGFVADSWPGSVSITNRCDHVVDCPASAFVMFDFQYKTDKFWPDTDEMNHQKIKFDEVLRDNDPRSDMSGTTIHRRPI